MTTPDTVEELVAQLKRLRLKREERKDTIKKALGTVRRRALSRQEREQVHDKTKGRCHVCGGRVDDDWKADHVVARSAGGQDVVDNFLPAHRHCNQCRWDYSAEEFRVVLKLGVWARTQVERQTATGRDIAERFLAYEFRRTQRRGR